MKNPFEKENHKGLIAGAAIGAAIAAGLAYLFFTEDGEKLLNDLQHKLKDKIKDLGAGIVSDKTGLNKSTVKKAADVVAE